MDKVDKETFAYWVTHPQDIGSGNLLRLEETTKAFPYCQISYALLAKAAADSGSSRLTELVPLAAAYTLNRGALRRLVENESAWSGALLDRLTELPQNRYGSRDRATPYGKDRPISLVRFEDRFPKPAEKVEVKEDVPPETPPMEETVLAEKNIEDELTYKRLKPTPIPAIELLPLPTPRADERRKQQEIIEAFIRNDPRIGPIRPDATTPEPEVADLSQRAQGVSLGGLATESFAKILLKQGKIDKAIDIYEKLKLKNPEKSDYFAQKIAELDNDK
ncbi:hypothetical protein [Persicitalea sp.]|uniref:hypothetical protein n=1 Tax=Persicitalea sp. TaxID=3100273 RepID=UPI003593B877